MKTLFLASVMFLTSCASSARTELVHLQLEVQKVQVDILAIKQQLDRIEAACEKVIKVANKRRAALDKKRRKQR